MPSEKQFERKLRTLKDLAVSGQAVLVRVDFNVSLGDDGKIDRYEDYRIKAVLSTLQALREKNNKILLVTHFGRPKALTPLPDELPWDLEPVRNRVSELLGVEVEACRTLEAAALKAAVARLPAQGVLLLPNIRLDPREEAGDAALAHVLAQVAQGYVNEAFSNSHRAHASMSVLPTLLPSVAGQRTATEVQVLDRLRAGAKRPYVAIVSGAKVGTKVGLLRDLLQKVDQLFLGGRMANVFLAAAGKYMSDEFEADDLALAREVWESSYGKIVLPLDVVIGPREASEAETQTVLVDAIPATTPGIYDIGPQTVRQIVAGVQRAQTLLWNGPLGLTEVLAYERGTMALAQALAQVSAYRVIGGGDTVNVLERAHVTQFYDHVSVGGGALVTYLEGQPMPGLEPLYG